MSRYWGSKRRPNQVPVTKIGDSYKLNPYENEVQDNVLDALERHPLVAWRERMNTGMAEMKNRKQKQDPEAKGRMVKFAFTGCSDILGQLNDGRFLAVEVKRLNNDPTDEQSTFLERVNAHGGFAFVARGVDDVFHYLDRANEKAVQLAPLEPYLTALRSHDHIAWCEPRSQHPSNGLIIGQCLDGRMLACDVRDKKLEGAVTNDELLALVRRHHSLAFTAAKTSEVIAALEAAA